MDRMFRRNETLIEDLAYEVFVHEFAHILTLNANQVPPYTSPDYKLPRSCNTFFTGEGCSRESSYMYDFYEEFWIEIWDDYVAINGDPNDFDYEYPDSLDFYNKYPKRFVSEYAATNPEEDIVESFTHFILEDMSEEDSISDQKINFFYRYRELVELREEIRRE